MSSPAPQLATALADRYRIERELGQGGMATVYLARDIKHDREVALKVLKPELAAILGRERFLNEIRLTAKLDHPHILTLIDSGESEGFLWYVLPFIRGESLRARITREKQLGIEDALAITRQIAGALDYAHHGGVIHRDIKPENILLHEGEAMLADFGIALAVKEAGGNRLTETGLSLGTPQYMSPEQATGDRGLDTRSDVYSLGAVLYEMLAGEPPHSGPTAQSVIVKLMSERPVRLRTLRHTVSERIDGAVAKALAKSPADRFPSAGFFASALTDSSRPEPSDGLRSGIRSLALLVTIGCVIGLGGFLTWRRSHAPVLGAESVRLAVLPFESIGDSGDRAFADGMSEEIINRLARVPRLSLMGRSSALQYHASGKTAPEFGRALGVEYVLDGTVHWGSATGGARQVRISPELIKVADGTRIWGEPYEGVLANVFELQGDVAERVAVALRGALGTPEHAFVRAAPTSNVEAYRSYLLGRAVLGSHWWEAARAADHFSAAIALDSTFARAYAGLAITYSLGWDFGDRSLPRDTVYARARAAAHRALALDSTLAEAHTSLAWLLHVGDWDWQGADREFRRALELDPGDALCRQWYALHLMGLGRTAEAVSEARTALELDPLTPLVGNTLGLALWFDGKVDEAIGAFQDVIAWDSSGSVMPNLLGLYANEGRADEAAHVTRSDLSGWRELMVAIARAKKDPGARLSALKLVQARGQTLETSHAVLAGFYAMLGERETALTELERAAAAHEERLALVLKAWPALIPLHQEPRYLALVQRMGLP